MNKLRDWPLIKRMIAQQSDTRWTWNSAKVLLKKAAPGTLLALCGAVAIYVTASSVFTRRTDASSKASMGGPPAQVKKDLQDPPAGNKDGIIMVPGTVRLDTNHHGAIAENNSAIDQTPAPVLTPVPTPATERKTSVIDSESLERKRTEVEHKNPERQPRQAERKNLERKREEAERKRSRLEEMYQKHLISSGAYRKGEKEYKSEIEKYRSAVNAGSTEK